jgi:hypothetical protein
MKRPSMSWRNPSPAVGSLSICEVVFFFRCHRREEAPRSARETGDTAGRRSPRLDGSSRRRRSRKTSNAARDDRASGSTPGTTAATRSLGTTTYLLALRRSHPALLVPGGVVPRVVLRLVRVERGSRERVAAFSVLRARIAHLLVRHRGNARVPVTGG